MNDKDIVKMCQRLARKYNDPQEFNDLVSEGVIKALEMMREGKTDKNLLYSYVQGVMNEYYNIRRHIVYVPVQGKAKAPTMENESDKWTDVAMHNALRSDLVDLDENTATTPSAEIEYEKKEWLRYVKMKAYDVLDRVEWKIISMRYFDNMTQDEVAKQLSQHQVWVHRKEKAALEKIRNNL